MVLMLAGMIEFGSKSRISGCNTLKLVTTCIYQWSRNLQYLGWFLVLLGISFIGRSGLALLHAIIGIVLFRFCITRIEEAHLERTFKEKYISCKKVTPRYIGISKRKPTRNA
ncbi:MAG: hypothetical protein JSW72_04540 [Candidatus Bathyarchaeota archaeon]|nr:MAG: hypothetical protein JSW72_04540 [Candidatus Bathyarchaeota archaeon]